MSSSRCVRWLLNELPALEAGGVLSAEAAAALRRHYSASPATSPIGLIISAVLGATLLGSGLILILGHNWDQLTRPMRTVISFLPLTSAIAISAFVLLRRGDSLSWRESAAIFHALAVAASIALVGQTWHIAGDFFEFVFTWMLLTLPLAYVLRATLPCALYIVGITVWAGGMLETGTPRHIPLPMLALAVPFYIGVVREQRRGHRAAWLSVLLALAVPLIVGFSMGESRPVFWILAFTGLATAMYLAGVAFFEEDSRRLSHPFRAIGGLGVAALTIALSYRDVWGWSIDRPRAAQPVEWIYSLGWPLLAVGLAVLCWRRRHDANPAAAALPLVAAAGAGLTLSTHSGTAAALLFNGFALVLGLVTLIRGVRSARIGSANAGMLIIGALIVARFFDAEFSFVARGVAFMLVGAGFLAANVFLLRRRRALQ